MENFKSKNFKSNNKNYRKKRSTYMDNPSFSGDAVKAPSEGTINPYLSEKALGKLPKSSVTLKVDPYTNIEPHSVPYNVLANANKRVGGSYSGIDNLDGGNVQQYANSNRSKFLDSIDYCLLKLKVNYRYLPTVASAKLGTGLIDEARKAINEAFSLLQATTFTQLAINDYVVETDMPMGSAKTESVAGKNVYTNTPDVLFAAFIYYQITLQDIINSFDWHNSFRAKQGVMIRNSWNRETPQLNSLFGLFNKKAFLNLLDGISLSFMGEYVDQEWIRQAAMLNVVPSRKTNSMHDPVCEIQTRYNRPSYFRLYTKGSSEGATVLITQFDSDNAAFSAGITALSAFNDALSANAIAGWARQNIYNGVTDNANAYYNDVVNNLSLINDHLSYFKAHFADVRECMDVMTRTGVVSWAKGFRPVVSQDTDAPMVDNLIVDDIFKLSMSGASNINFNNETKRWRTFSLWNYYTGIPEYDAKSGGVFLSLSLKEVVNPVDDDHNSHYVPVGLTYDGTKSVSMLNRYGKYFTVSAVDTVMDDDLVLCRLAPLSSQDDLSIKVPTLAYNAKHTTSEKSFIYATMLNLFGMGGIYTASNTLDIGLDPDIIAVYQIEVEDFTNAAIAYARNNSPFHAQTITADAELGFYGSIKGGKV